MTDQWIQGHRVELVVFHDQLVLKLDHDIEVVISAPMDLTLPAFQDYPREVLKVAANVPSSMRPLLGIGGDHCASCDWDSQGTLMLEFVGGLRIEVPGSPDITAWEIYSKHDGYVTCLPDGEVCILRKNQHGAPARRADPVGQSA